MGAFFECYLASSIHGPLRQRLLPAALPDKDMCCTAYCCSACSLAQMSNEIELRQKAQQPVYQRPPRVTAPQVVYVTAPGQMQMSAPPARARAARARDGLLTNAICILPPPVSSVGCRVWPASVRAGRLRVGPGRG